MEKKLLVVIANKKFFPQAKQVFSSAYINGGWNGDMMLLTNKNSINYVKPFQEKGILIKSFNINKLFKTNKYSSKYWPSVVFLKLYLLDSFFKKRDSIVALDADTIINYDISNLAKLNGFRASKSMHIGVPLSSQIVPYKKRIDNKSKSEFTKLIKKYDLNNISFNSGVIVYSTNIITSTTFNEVVELYKEYKDLLLLPEEFILNLYFYKKWNKLSLVYNNCINFLDSKKINKINALKGAITHYAGIKENSKPWEKSHFDYNRWSYYKNIFDKLDFNGKNENKTVKLTKKRKKRLSQLYIKLSKNVTNKYLYKSPHDGFYYLDLK